MNSWLLGVNNSIYLPIREGVYHTFRYTYTYQFILKSIKIFLIFFLVIFITSCMNDYVMNEIKKLKKKFKIIFSKNE